jgi:nucleotide-binding universal stress UspA family protein
MLQQYKSRAKQYSHSITSINDIEASRNDVTEEILKIADKEGIDTIIIGSRGTLCKMNSNHSKIERRERHVLYSAYTL